jgi:hypothetical protein
MELHNTVNRMDPAGSYIGENINCAFIVLSMRRAVENIDAIIKNRMREVVFSSGPEKKATYFHCAVVSCYVSHKSRKCEVHIKPQEATGRLASVVVVLHHTWQITLVILARVTQNSRMWKAVLKLP